MDEQDVDPFHGLEGWAKDVERRAKRAQRLHRLRSIFVRRRRAPREPRVRGRAGSVLWVAGIVVVSGLALATTQHLASRPPSGAYPTQSAPAGVYATTTATAAPTDPFEGTPAAGYPQGDAGITLPPAVAVTGFSAAQVDSALRQVRAALVAGRLDPAMLRDHSTAAFESLLAPNDRTYVHQWFLTWRFRDVATWIDPKVTLDPHQPPRVSGRVTFASVGVNGVPTLQVTTNFVWVYPFVDGPQRVAAVHDDIRWDFAPEKRVRRADAGMWVGEARSYFAWIDCAAWDRGLLAPDESAFGGALPAGAEDPDAVLRPDHSLDIVNDCAGK